MDAPAPIRSTSRRVGLALVAAALLVVALVAGGRTTAPFGDSDGGINGAVWASNSRALREEGLVESRLGGLREDGTVYATHPPLIVVETALAESLLGERPWVTRLPAWLGTVAALVVLLLLARDLGASPLVGGAAVAATALSPMVWTYGPMLDTPVTSFPFGVAVLWAWHRTWWADDQTAPPRPPVWALGCLAVLAGLAGWQAALLAAGCGVTLGVRRLARSRGGWAPPAAMVSGALVGMGLSIGWTRWAYGDLDVLFDKFGGRSGSSTGIGLADMVNFQLPWLMQLLGLGLVGLGGCVAALWRPRYRPLAAMSLGIVVGYALVFRQAAAGHQYWNYWALLPVAVGFVHLFDRLARRTAEQATALLVGAVVLVGLGNLVAVPHDAADYIEQGIVAVDAVRASPPPPTQRTYWYVGPAYRPDAWLSYETGLSPVLLGGRDQLDEVAARAPDDLVLVTGACEPDEAGTAFCEEVLDRLGAGTAVVLPAAELEQRLPARG